MVKIIKQQHQLKKAETLKRETDEIYYPKHIVLHRKNHTKRLCLFFAFE